MKLRLRKPTLATLIHVAQVLSVDLDAFVETRTLGDFEQPSRVVCLAAARAMLRRRSYRKLCKLSGGFQDVFVLILGTYLAEAVFEHDPVTQALISMSGRLRWIVRFRFLTYPYFRLRYG